MASRQPTSIPIRSWVPKWLGNLTAFVILLPIILINGTYTGSITEVSGTLGVMSEDISMAYYAASIGMAVAYPLVPRIRSFITTKTVLLSGLVLQVLLSFVCASSNSMDVIILCSFVIGFLKAFAMMEVMIMIRPIFSPGNVRSEFYAYYYPIVFSAGQISMALTAEFAYRYQWQYMYYFVIILLLVAILLILLFFRYGQRRIKIPFKEFDGPSILLSAVPLLAIVYVAIYGKTLDWFQSAKISLLVVAVPILIWLFVHRQQTMKKPFLRLEVLNDSKVLVGNFYMMLVMFFSSTSSLITQYLMSVLRVDSVHTNSIYLWMLPGFALGGLICFWWFRLQKWRFRYLIGIGMLCFVIYLGMVYFTVSPSSSYQMLFIPTILRGMGMLILFIAFGVYCVEDINPKLMIHNAFFLISCRSVLAPALSSSFFSNMLYRTQQVNMERLSETLTMQDPLAAQQYSNAFQHAVLQGSGIVEASQTATYGLYSTLQIQSLLLSVKEILGYVLIGALILMIVSCFIPFHKTVKVAIVKAGDDMI